MGWKTKCPEIGVENGFTSWTGDRDVADELFGRRGGQAEDEVVDVRGKRAAGFDLVDPDLHERRDRPGRRREGVAVVDPGPARRDLGEETASADRALAGRAGRPVDDRLRPAGRRFAFGESHVGRYRVLLPGRDRNARGQKGHERSPGGVRAGQQRRARGGRACGVQRGPRGGAVGVGVMVESLQVRVEGPSGNQVLSQSCRSREDEQSRKTGDATTHDGPPRRESPRARPDQATDSRTTAMPCPPPMHAPARP
jgi:hypothetical protein